MLKYNISKWRHATIAIDTWRKQVVWKLKWETGILIANFGTMLKDNKDFRATVC